VKKCEICSTVDFKLSL